MFLDIYSNLMLNLYSRVYNDLMVMSVIALMIAVIPVRIEVVAISSAGFLP